MPSQKRLIQIFQVELTNFCDMACPYCPHSAMTRPKGHMSAQVLEKCLDHLKIIGKPEVLLHHFGESLLHPHLEERLRQVKETNLVIQFSTNGTLLSKKLPMLIALDTRMDITLSVHQWREQPVATFWEALASYQEMVQGTQIRILRPYNVNREQFFFCKWVNGRVREWDYHKECYFLRENSAVVLWNGDMVSCCIDCHGESAFSNITMPGAPYTTTIPWRGCPSCDLGYRSQRELV